jgi:hypothetical protein
MSNRASARFGLCLPIFSSQHLFFHSFFFCCKPDDVPGLALLPAGESKGKNGPTPTIPIPAVLCGRHVRYSFRQKHLPIAQISNASPSQSFSPSTSPILRAVFAISLLLTLWSVCTICIFVIVFFFFLQDCNSSAAWHFAAADWPRRSSASESFLLFWRQRVISHSPDSCKLVIFYATGHLKVDTLRPRYMM